MYYIGIDIGSTSSKTVVLNKQRSIVYKFIIPSGWNSIDTSNLIKEDLYRHGFVFEKSTIVATGYGRVCVNYADKTITEISCHANGAIELFDVENAFVIDIGGQDTKIIEICNKNVANFLMNDKCSAGTGRFLEVMANSLGMSPAEVCNIAKKGSNTKISSMCTVFAESEIISLSGKGEKKENIAFAIVNSIVDKVISMTSKFDLQEKNIILTGGLCFCPYLVECLENKLNKKIITNDNVIYSGAVGAAFFASNLKG